MLVLTRKTDQEIVINDQIIVKVLKVKGSTIRLGIQAPDNVPIQRAEIRFDGTQLDSAKAVALVPR